MFVRKIEFQRNLRLFYEPRSSFQGHPEPLRSSDPRVRTPMEGRHPKDSQLHKQDEEHQYVQSPSCHLLLPNTPQTPEPNTLEINGLKYHHPPAPNLGVAFSLKKKKRGSQVFSCQLRDVGMVEGHPKLKWWGTGAPFQQSSVFITLQKDELCPHDLTSLPLLSATMSPPDTQNKL